ncbi:hypothetical protein [Caulobacter sp. S45]|uniref:hypothetical protein n=1 Tax=Caulobacter sp. S45 TaxID=1641861 RepID=UPI001576993A|nr:hypothetical protein [Caulobacter sp. S45]
MSCDIAMSAAILLASFHPGPHATPQLMLAALADAPAPAAGAINPLAREPLYADIVRRAGLLKAEVSTYRAAPAGTTPLPGFAAFKTDVAALSDLDMQGHLDLAKRGTDGDLKCILRGISQDLPRKLTEVEQASTADARSAALQDIFYLLRDNVEVITSPAVPTV